MSVNKYHSHIFVLPEDDANRQLAVGFVLECSTNTRQVYVLPVADGWTDVLRRFNSDHIHQMRNVAQRFMILLIDFDREPDRLNRARAEIPEDLIARVFILGAWTEPEDLRTDLGFPEEIGRALARDCRDGTDLAWGHRLLQHNTGEIERLRSQLRPILF